MPAGRPLRSGARLAVAAVLILACLAAAPAAAQCVDAPSDPGVCLLGDRFKVTVEWQDFPGNPFSEPGAPNAGVGEGTSIQTSGNIFSVDTAWFSFFGSGGIDLVVKVVDGAATNDHFWVYYAGVTNVEYTITVTDTQTGNTVAYTNSPGFFDAHIDIDTLPASAAAPLTRVRAATGVGAGSVHRAVIRPAGRPPGCDDPAVACVHGDRFGIEARYQPDSPGDPVEDGVAVLSTETSALFQYFSVGPDVAVKVVDGREVNGNFWVVVSAVGAPRAVIRVTDLETGKSTDYAIGPDDEAVFADRQAFAPDPPSATWLETPELPGFRFQTRISAGREIIPTRQEADCIPETLCISGAVPGRSELFLRIVGPKPNGFLHPNVVKFSTSQIEVWIEQLATGLVNYYLLDGAAPGSSELTGFFDRFGFEPTP